MLYKDLGEGSEKTRDKGKRREMIIISITQMYKFSLK